MTDSITRILANTKKIFRTKNNNLSCVVIADDENGKETNYTLNFNYDGITVGRTVVNNNKIEVITNIHEYNRDVFLFVLKNFNTLMGDINEFNNTINLTLNNIPAMVFSNSVFRKEAYDGEEIYDGDKYIDDFIAYNNKKHLINNSNYFTFLKITAEAGNLQIFNYLGYTYNEYKNNLSKKQMAILIYTACKRNSAFIEKMHDLNFIFGFELLKLAVDNNDYEVLEYLYYNGININAVEYRQTILDYAFEKNTNIKIVEFLLNLDIKILNRYYFIRYIKENPEIIKILFKRCDIIDILKIIDSSGCSVAHEIARNENPEIVKLLFERCDTKNILNIIDFSGQSVFRVIARNKNPEVVKLLFEREDIDYILRIRDNYDWSVAHDIAENENLEIVKFLFERKNMDDILKIRGGFIGESVFHVIARNKNPEIVKLLFEREDIDDILRFENSELFSVAHVMAWNYNPEVFELLFKRSEIKNFLKKKNKCGLTVINIMVKNRNPEVIKFLLTREDLKLEKRDINSIKENFSNNEEITNLLLARGLISANDATNKKKTCIIC